MDITRAIIPAAGKGSRLYPETKLIAKEMMLVGYKPMIHHVLEECYAAGARRAAVVLAPHKRGAVQDHIENETGLSKRMRITYLEQAEPIGLADAISTAKDFTAGEPVFLALPDNIIAAGNTPGPLGLLQKSFAENPTEHAALYGIDEEKAKRFSHSGLADLEPHGELFRITAIHDKNRGNMDVSEGKSVHKIFGRYLLTPSFFEAIENVRPEPGGETEFDDVNVWQALLDSGRTIVGVPFGGTLFDCGNRAGLEAANRFFERKF
jgi:UTP--glucose-1-phosphate uridylyltransferase